MRTGIGFLLIILVLNGFAASPTAENADLILYNGKVITMSPGDRIVQAVAVRGDTILAVGSDAEITSLAGPGCTQIDLAGKTVTPGLIDSHYHLMYYGSQFSPGFLDIRYPAVTSKAGLLQRVSDYVQTLQPGEWVSGNQGFTLQPFETLDRWDLDAVTPNNPVYLRHGSGQFSVVNSAALDTAGITRDTPDPPGSLVMKDSLGEPTGVLSHYPAENLVGQYATGYGDRTDAQKLEDIERGQQLCLSAGYTSVQDVIVGQVGDIRLYKQYADSGLLKVRVYAMLLVDTEAEADTAVKIFAGAKTDSGSGFFRFGGWKLAQDGGITARTSLFYDKTLYAASLSYPYHTQEELNRLVQKLYDTGLQVAVHVGGDQGIDMTLTAFEEAVKANPRPDPRFRIEHGLFPTASALQRMKEGGIILSTQPQWISWYADGYGMATNEATMSRLMPLKTMLAGGIHLAFGCDVPASFYQEPRWAFHGAVLRRSVQSGTEYNPGQKLIPREALYIHTMGSAYAAFADSVTGSLEPGKLADLVVWSHDLYGMDPSDLVNLAAEMTIVGGNIVYNSGSIPVAAAPAGRDLNQSPERFRLFHNYPNPFNPATSIRFHAPRQAYVELAVMNALGERIRTLFDQWTPAGQHTVRWDGRDDFGRPVAGGLYYFILKADGERDVRKAVLLK